MSSVRFSGQNITFISDGVTISYEWTEDDINFNYAHAEPNVWDFSQKKDIKDFEKRFGSLFDLKQRILLKEVSNYKEQVIQDLIDEAEEREYQDLDDEDRLIELERKMDEKRMGIYKE